MAVAANEFKAGVAYMEVPRCDQCGFWGGVTDRDHVENKWCRVLNIHTGASFGCVRWADRNAVPAPVVHTRRKEDQ